MQSAKPLNKPFTNTLFNLPAKTLLAAALIALAHTASAAEQNVQELDTMKVTSAGGFEQSLTYAPASISVISAEDLQRKQFRDLAEALSDVEGVDVRSSTGKTGGLDISIRGMPSEYTLILIDGRRQNVAGDVTPNGFGAALTSFMPPISAIERIEVIRGPMSTLYGSDAVGGVVNIITKKVSDSWGGSLRMETSLPESSRWGVQQKTEIYATGPLIQNTLGLTMRGSTAHREASDWIVAAGAPKSGRNPAPAESDLYNLGARLTYTPTADHDISLDVDRGMTVYNNDDGRLGNRDQPILDANIGNLPGYKDEMRLNRNQYVLAHTGRFASGVLNSSVSYSTTETLGRTIPGKVADLGNPYTGHPNIIVGDDRTLETTNTVIDTKYVASLIDNNTTTLGAQYWRAELEDGIIPNKLDQTMVAVFAENEWYITNDLALTVGGRYDDHDAFGGHFSPRAYLVWGALDQLTIKGGVNQGYRAPRLNQLADGISGVTGQGATISIGNPNLKPETSTNTELSFLYDSYKGASGSITFFHNQIEDRITSNVGNCADNWISSCSANPTATYAMNIDEATTWGAEVTAKFELPANLSLGMNYTWTDSEVKEKGAKNGKLGNIPEHLFNSTLNWAALDQMDIWLKGSYRGKANRFTGAKDKLTGDNKITYDAVGDLKAYVLFDLGATYRVSPQLSLNATVANLLDKDFAKFATYKDANGNLAYVGEYWQGGQSMTGGVIQGRTYTLSANYNF